MGNGKDFTLRIVKAHAEISGNLKDTFKNTGEKFIEQNDNLRLVLSRNKGCRACGGHLLLPVWKVMDETSHLIFRIGLPSAGVCSNDARP